MQKQGTEGLRQQNKDHRSCLCHSHGRQTRSRWSGQWNAPCHVPVRRASSRAMVFPVFLPAQSRTSKISLGIPSFQELLLRNHPDLTFEHIPNSALRTPQSTKVVGFFEGFVLSQKMSRRALSRIPACTTSQTRPVAPR